MTLIIGVVDAAEWEGSRPEDIRQVCLSAAQCFGLAVAENPVEPIRIEPSTGTIESPRPMTSYQRLDTGHVRVILSARRQLWAKFAYQFAHEFCHVLANFRPPLVHPAAWIEETLCETASLFALRSMASRWRIAPPYRIWADYSEALTSYANNRLADPWSSLPAGVNFTEWLAASLPMLEQKPYEEAQIQKRIAIAARLLPLFEEDPGAWRAVRYLNLWSTSDDVQFANFFSMWRSVTPSGSHAAVDSIERLLA